MPGNSQKIISYIADASQLLTTIKTIEQANTRLARLMGNDFSKATKVISSDIGKIKNVEIFDENGLKSQVKLIEEMSTVVQTADGSFIKFSESVKNVDATTKEMSGSITDVTGKYLRFETSQNKLIGQSSQLATNLSSVSDINQKFGKELKNVGRITGVVKQNIASFSGNTKKLGTVVQGANGKFYQLTETIKRTPDGVQKVSRSVKEVSEAFATGTKATVSMTQNVARLAKRAVLTIPVWLALRGAITGTTQIIRDGIKAIIDQDKAFEKARRNISATATTQGELTSAMKELKTETLKLSLASGKSVDELTNAFQRFATVGFDAKTSLIGMQYATKLAVVEFGDAKETADAFARSMRVLIDDSAGAKSEGEQLAEAMALTDKLWKTNAFEIKEFTNNLQKFAGTAKIANLSAEETIKLLATLSTGGLANRAGRLLKTTIIKALANLDKVAEKLNLNLDPAVNSTYDILFKLIHALKQVGVEQKAPVELASTLKDLFSIKGTEVLSTFTALEKTLKENAKIVPDVKELDKAFKSVSETTGVLSDRFHKANQAIGKAFVSEILGGSDFNKTLLTIVKSLEGMITTAKKAGYVINSVGVGLERIYKLGKLLTSFSPLKNLGLTNELSELISNGYKLKQLQQNLYDTRLEAIDFGKSMEQALKGNLDIEGLKRGIAYIKDKLKSPKLSIGIDNKVLQRSLSVLQHMLVVKQSTLDTTKNQAQAEKDISQILSGYLDSSFAQEESKKKLLEYTKELLKIQGFSESETLKTEKKLIAQLDIEDKIGDKLDRQLQLQQALRKEKALQNNLSSTALKLFDIAKTQGTKIAKTISEVLSGDIDFSSFVRKGGKAVEVFKKQFNDIFKAQQAKAFFKGETVPGIKGLRGGANITLPEEDTYLQKSKTQVVSLAKQELNLAQARLAIEEKINALRTHQLLQAKEPQNKNAFIPNPKYPEFSKTIEEQYNKFKENIKDISYASIHRTVKTQPIPKPISKFTSQVPTPPPIKGISVAQANAIATAGINISTGDINITSKHDINEINKKLDEQHERTKKEIAEKFLGKQGGKL